MSKPPIGTMPFARRNGVRQLSVSLDPARCEALETLRAERGLRSWADAVRVAIDLAVPVLPEKPKRRPL